MASPTDNNLPAWMDRTETTANPMPCVQALLAQSMFGDPSPALVATLG